MKPLLFLGLIFPLIFSVSPAPAAPPAPPAVSLRVIQSPCSLAKLCQVLSREFNTSVAPDPALADLRVVWAFSEEKPLESILSCLAKLTDSRVVTRVANSGRRRYILERKPDTGRREEAWRTSRLSHSLQEAMRAADQFEQRKLDPSAFSPGLRTYLDMGRASQLKYLRALSADQMNRLLQGEVVRLPANAVSDEELQNVVAERYVHVGQDPDESAEHIQQYIRNDLEQARRNGLALGIDFERKGSAIHLVLYFGGRGANVLCRFMDDELGLPLTRTNPYRFLEHPDAAPAAPTLPDAFRRSLEADLLLPPGGRWESMVRELARAAHVDLVSDAYLSRYQSLVYTRGEQKVMLARRGVPVAEALDLVCQKYGYLWWEKDGCCYLRARAWVWDNAYEVPDRFLDAWTAAVARRAIGAGEITALASLTPLQQSGLDALGGSPFIQNLNLGFPHIQQFLGFFKSCGPAQQLQILGPGMTVNPDLAQAFPELFKASPAAPAGQPAVLRLTSKIGTASPATPAVSPATPPATRVNLLIELPGRPGEFRMPFSVDIPQLPSPFVPR
jgi:hypothetical protein